MDACNAGNIDEQDVLLAASLVFLDGVLYILGFHEAKVDWLREMGYSDDEIASHQATAIETQALLAELAEKTRNRPEPALSIAHCIRDLAYGDERRADNLRAMLQSEDPEYHRIFVDAYWLPTEEERVREEAEQRREEQHTLGQVLHSSTPRP